MTKVAKTERLTCHGTCSEFILTRHRCQGDAKCELAEKMDQHTANAWADFIGRSHALDAGRANEEKLARY